MPSDPRSTNATSGLPSYHAAAEGDLLARLDPGRGLGIEQVPAIDALLRLDVAPRQTHVDDGRAGHPEYLETYFDKKTNKTLTWNGKMWVDAMGNPAD